MNHAVAEQISDPTARIDDRLVGPGYQAVMQPGLRARVDVRVWLRAAEHLVVRPDRRSLLASDRGQGRTHGVADAG
jgi:hypothetical protein